MVLDEMQIVQYENDMNTILCRILLVLYYGILMGTWHYDVWAVDLFSLIVLIYVPSTVHLGG
jgi:hypothetical protein